MTDTFHDDAHGRTPRREGLSHEDNEAHGAGFVRHEEHLVAGVVRTESGRIEARKRIVEEEVTITIPMRREVVDFVRVLPDGSEEPVEAPADAWEPRIVNRGLGEAEPEPQAQAAPNRSSADGELEIVLHEERPVVSSEVYAVERVRVTPHAVQSVVPVEGEVQREVVEIEDDEANGPRHKTQQA